MLLNHFLQKITNNENISFNETIEIISRYYDYQATEFCNGSDDNILMNVAGTNEGSCKIFAFAKINQLTVQQTLNLFGDFYRKDVLENPSGSEHKNIRNFMQYGWEGIKFRQQPLKHK